MELVPKGHFGVLNSIFHTPQNQLDERNLLHQGISIDRNILFQRIFNCISSFYLRHIPTSLHLSNINLLSKVLHKIDSYFQNNVVANQICRPGSNNRFDNVQLLVNNIIKRPQILSVLNEFKTTDESHANIKAILENYQVDISNLNNKSKICNRHPNSIIEIDLKGQAPDFENKPPNCISITETKQTCDNNKPPNSDNKKRQAPDFDNKPSNSDSNKRQALDFDNKLPNSIDNKEEQAPDCDNKPQNHIIDNKKEQAPDFDKPKNHIVDNHKKDQAADFEDHPQNPIVDNNKKGETPDFDNKSQNHIVDNERKQAPQSDNKPQKIVDTKKQQVPKFNNKPQNPIANKKEQVPQCDNKPQNHFVDNNKMGKAPGFDNKLPNMIVNNEAKRAPQLMKPQNPIVKDNKKRQAPDFDNFDLKSTKRTKSERKTPDFASDTFDSLIDIDKPYSSLQGISNKSESFLTVTEKWNVQQLSDPHIDHTYHTTQNFRPKDTHLTEKNISCLVIFDEEIKKLDENINDVDAKISILHKQYSECNDFRESSIIYDKVYNFRHYENQLKDQYASMCETRDEVFELYVGRKRSLNFNAEYISRYEFEANRETRNIIDTYEKIYGSS